MADEPAAAGVPPAAHSKLLPVVIVVLLMLGEAVGIFFLANAMQSGPASAAASDGISPDAGDGLEAQVPAAEPIEIDLIECRPSNKMSGKLITFQIRISILVPIAMQEQAGKLIEAKQARLRDRTNFVIRSAELVHLNEPGLETIKRRLKHEYGRILGDDELIIDVLIPEWLQSSAGV